MDDNKIMVYDHQHFAKERSFCPSQLGSFSSSSQLGSEKEHLLRKLKCWIKIKYLSYLLNNSLLHNCKQVKMFLTNYSP